MSEASTVGYADTTLRDLAAPPWGAAIGVEELAAVAAVLADTGATVLEALDPESAHVALEYRAESPWDRLRAIVRQAGATPVGVAIAGWTLLGDRPVSADLVRRFVLCAAESGAGRVRVFDALNDAARQAPAAEAAAESGIGFVPTLMVGPVPESSDPRWLDEARELAALPGAGGICVSDKAGHLTPSALGELVVAVAAATGLPVEVAVRAPGGLAPVSATAAAVAGAASVQAAAGLVALVACRPSAETLRAALVGWHRSLRCDPDALDAAARLVGRVLQGDVMDRAAATAAGPAVPLPPELTAGVSARLARLGLRRGLAQVAAEAAAVAGDLGAVTLGHPVGEAIVSQAVDHVVEGRRWAETGVTLAEVALGRIGRLRGPVAPEALAAAEAAGVPEPREPAGPGRRGRGRSVRAQRGGPGALGPVPRGDGAPARAPVVPDPRGRGGAGGPRRRPHPDRDDGRGRRRGHARHLGALLPARIRGGAPHVAGNGIVQVRACPCPRLAPFQGGGQGADLPQGGPHLPQGGKGKLPVPLHEGGIQDGAGCDLHLPESGGDG